MKRRNSKKLFSLLASLLLILAIVPGAMAQAAPASQAQILSTEVPQEVISYADSVLPEHLHAMSLTPAEYGLGGCDLSQLALGTPFNVYQLNDASLTDTQNYYFPLLCNNQIVALLAVADNNGTLSSTFSQSFAKTLNGILSANRGRAFRLVSVENELLAVDDAEALLVSDDMGRSDAGEKSPAEVIGQVSQFSKQNEEANRYEETPVMATRVSHSRASLMAVRGPVGPTDSVSRNVPYVSQEGKNWCWAATCASIINYKKGKNLTAADVVKYTFNGKTPNTGGTTQQDLAAYRHWGLSPYSDPQNVSWSSATSELKSRGPIHSLWYSLNGDGHSMTVRGYEYYADRDGKVYLLVEPNSGYASVTGQTDSGDCCFILSGIRYYWTASLRNF